MRKNIKKSLNVTAIIIAKNEASMISNCIDGLHWCDQIIVVDNGSTDQTAELASSAGAKVIHHATSNFAEQRNVALKYVKTEWIFYIDADERITPRLFQEIAVNIETNEADILKLTRQNVCYGQELRHGGWEQDIVTRVFKKSSLIKWTGMIHESPEFEGTVKQLHTPLIHLTHRSTADNLKKSSEWTIKEAILLAEKQTEAVTFKTLLRKGIMEFIRRAYLKKGYKDGMPGIIEALVQAMNRVMVYIQVWELTQTPTLEEKYANLEQQIADQWKMLERSA
jgi:glycosyltransferase involved in cell wall biosynthesis